MYTPIYILHQIQDIQRFFTQVRRPQVKNSLSVWSVMIQTSIFFSLIFYPEFQYYISKYLLNICFWMSHKCLKIYRYWGAWVSQLVKRLTLAQVKIPQFMGSSPVSGSVLTAQSLKPAWIVCLPPLSAPPHSWSVSLKNKQTLKNLF